VWEDLAGDVEYGTKSRETQRERVFMQLAMPFYPRGTLCVHTLYFCAAKLLTHCNTNSLP
jgi:hypothetical protein